MSAIFKHVSIQEKTEIMEEYGDNGTCWCWQETDAGGGRETGNLFGVALIHKTAMTSMHACNVAS